MPKKFRRMKKEQENRLRYRYSTDTYDRWTMTYLNRQIYRQTQIET